MIQPRHAVILCLLACASEAPDVPVVDPTAGAPREDLPDEPIGPLHFRNASARLGPDLERPGGRGVALVDFDQDGWPDVTVLTQNEIRLLRGVGEGLFLPHQTIEFDFGQAATWVDVDGDGDLDLFASSVYPRHGLFANDGQGFLTDVTDAAGLGGQMPPGGQGGGFGDVDGDGDLDLYLCFAAPPHDLQDAQAAWGETGAANHLYLNDGTGRFTRRPDLLLEGIEGGETFMGVLFDVDDDLDLDLFAVHDFRHDQLFRNDGGSFSDASADWLPGGGQEPSSIMGIDIADWDGDGDLDLYGTQRGQDLLYVAQPGGQWTNHWPTLIEGYDPTPQITGWGNAMADVDNDGDLDLVATSNYETILDANASGEALRTGWMVLFETIGEGDERRLVDRSGEAGSLFDSPIDGFGLATGDIDRDGDVDVLVGIDGTGDKADPDAHPRTLLMVNDGAAATDHGWLGLRVRQPGTPNPFAVGAQVEVLGRGIRTKRPILAGASYLSSQPDRLHFGLGRYHRAPAVRVRWPDGHETIWLDLPSGEHDLIRSEARCCTGEGCDDAPEAACLARLADRSGVPERCRSACERLAACCGAPPSCEQECAAMPLPDWSAQCLVATGCDAVSPCLGYGKYAVTSACD